MLKEEEIPEVDIQGHVSSFSQPIKHSDCLVKNTDVCLMLLLFYELTFPSVNNKACLSLTPR